VARRAGRGEDRRGQHGGYRRLPPLPCRCARPLPQGEPIEKASARPKVPHRTHRRARCPHRAASPAPKAPYRPPPAAKNSPVIDDDRAFLIPSAPSPALQGRRTRRTAPSFPPCE